MLELSAAATEAIQRSYTMRIRAESWLGEELLAQDVPVSDGTETIDLSQNVPENLTLTIPRVDRGVTWDPLSDNHPLASDGQRLRVELGIELGSGDVEWIQRGWFLITDSDSDGDTVTVTADGLLRLIDEARFVTPFEPKGTFISTVRALVEPALTVSVDGALADRSVPVGMHWDEDRLGGLNELLDAWPAEAQLNEDGVLRISPPRSTYEPVTSITDNREAGTVIKWNAKRSRDGAFNIVVARGEDANGNLIQGVAMDQRGSSPHRYGGPFNALPVPHLFASPLLKTTDQCFIAARTILERKRRGATRKISASLIPHPGLIAGDLISVTSATAGLADELVTIEHLTLPYRPEAMSLSLVTL